MVSWPSVDWAVVGDVATVLAGVAVALYSALLWKVNHRLMGIQLGAERRNDAILHLEQTALLNDEHGEFVAERGVAFRIWNSGIKDTQILDCYIEQTDGHGERQRVDVEFRRQVPTYETVTPFIPQAVKSPSQWHLVGEFLQSGEMWEVEAWLTERRGVRTARDPEIVVVPVLGHPKRLRIEDMLRLAISDGKRKLHAGERPPPAPGQR